MKQAHEPLFEGTYQYCEHEQNYSQENFLVEKSEGNNHFIFNAEILSRVETGEFFKMHIHYTVNQYYVPQTLTIEKSLGDKLAREVFEIDPVEQILRYTFKTRDQLHTVERPFNATKHYLAAPCFVTAGLFTMTKKIDTTARTPIYFVSPRHEWEFRGAPEDKIMWIDVKNHDTEELELNGIPLTANKYELHEEDALSGNVSQGAQIWISKHYAIPYQLEDSNGNKILIHRLKKLKNQMEKIF